MVTRLLRVTYDRQTQLIHLKMMISLASVIMALLTLGNIHLRARFNKEHVWHL